jgi:flavodoxin
MKSAVIIYWSKTGNTEKVAHAIREGLERAGVKVTVKRTEEAEGIDWFEYDLVCVGAPSYSWHTPEPMTRFLQSRFNHYRQQGRIRPSSPTVSGKNALVFCTYSGPHTGIDEAIPCGKYMGQFFEHLGITVLDEWYVLSEFHGSLENSTKGRMGDIRGKPTPEDLKAISVKAEKLAVGV